jgi:hypothetical protein
MVVAEDLDFPGVVSQGFHLADERLMMFRIPTRWPLMPT